THVREARPRYKLEKQRGLEIASAFFAASRSGDMDTLGALLAADVGMWSDGGGKRPAAVVPVLGFDTVLKLHRSIAVLLANYGSPRVQAALLCGQPGLVTREADGGLQTTALEIEAGQIGGIYVMRNPDKLRHMH